MKKTIEEYKNMFIEAIEPVLREDFDKLKKKEFFVLPYEVQVVSVGIEFNLEKNG